MLLLDEFLHAHRHDAFLAVAAVVGHDERLVAARTHFIFHDDEVLAAAGEHAQHAVACGFQGTDDGKHGGDANAATGAKHGAVVLDVGGVAQWTHHVGHVVADVQVAQLDG